MTTKVPDRIWASSNRRGKWAGCGGWAVARNPDDQAAGFPDEEYVRADLAHVNEPPKTAQGSGDVSADHIERLKSHAQYLRGDHEGCNPWLADTIDALIAQGWRRGGEQAAMGAVNRSEIVAYTTGLRHMIASDLYLPDAADFIERLAAERDDACRKGQEDMRERCASMIETSTTTNYHQANCIRALPIKENDDDA